MQILKSDCRSERLAWIRFLVFYVSLKTTSVSSVELGRRFNRDHSTVLHGVKAVQGRIDTDLEFSAKVNAWVEYFSGLAQKNDFGTLPDAAQGKPIDKMTCG